MSKLHANPAAEPIPISPSLDTGENPWTSDKEQPVNKRVFFLSLQAMFNALIIGFIAKILVALIGLFTNIAFYGRFSFDEVSPAHNKLGLFVIAIPIIGGLIVGVMARFGSSAIRGHGIPEAMENVLTNKSRIKPIITFLKPISAAISIGTGGPFGAEGPIIATGGAFGSVSGQIMHITANERKVMLAAGATAGMAAIFGTPVSAVLLAIELLLFEFSPRSIIPVALACATGAAMHFALFSTDPAFAMPDIPEPTSMAMVTYVVMGAVLGVLAAYVSRSVYIIEDLFEKLPIHWMWWPALGGLAVGIIGYFAPLTLGVGYSNITNLLTGQLPLQIVFSLCFLKFASWSLSLGSGTSGGTLAPLLTIGGAMGVLIGSAIVAVFPGSQVNIATCALIGMAAMFAGASRALLTSIIFALETTMQPHGLLPLLGACTASYFVSFFMMKGSIMTEKIERRGVFAPNAYEPDILQKVNIKEVYTENINLFVPDNTVKQAREWIKENALAIGDTTSFITVDDEQRYTGIVNRADIFNKRHPDETPVRELAMPAQPYVYENNNLSHAADIMGKYQIDMLPVISRDKKVIGGVSYRDIFTVYHKRHEEESIHTRAISLRRQGMRIVLKGKQMLNR